MPSSWQIYNNLLSKDENNTHVHIINEPKTFIVNGLGVECRDYLIKCCFEA